MAVRKSIRTGAITSPGQLAADDFRRIAPRFQDDNLKANLSLLEAVRAMAAEKGCTPGQLALAWVLARDDGIIPIPGTKRRRYLEENAAAADVDLTAADLAALDKAIPPGAASGERYHAEAMQTVNV